jgi:FixJ family two-component response regulator
VAEIKPTIFIVDDDPSVRDSMELLLESVGFDVKTFVSAQEFLNANLREGPGCLILDVRMPGMSGLDLQEKIGLCKNTSDLYYWTRNGPDECPRHEGRGR